MWAIVAIRALVKDLYQIFGDLALWCWDNDPPFGWFGDRFLDVYLALTDLHFALYEIALWFEDLEERVADVITESRIFQVLQTWLNYAEDAWNWVLYAFSNVVAIVDVWWDSIIPTVQGWITIATEGFDSLKVAWDSFWTITFPEWISSFDTLKAAWDNFWTVTFPSLVSFVWLGIWWNSRLLDIQSLIDTAIANLGVALEGWLEIKDSIFEFFADPLKWLYDRIEDFMDRYW